MAGTEPTQYALRPATPGRALVVIAITAILGIGLLAVGIVTDTNLALIISGAVLCVGALVLGVITASFMSMRTIHVELTDDGFDVRGPGYRRGAQWSEVTAINATPDGARLVVACGRVTRIFIQSPRGSSDDTVEQITNEMIRRLNRFIDHSGDSSSGT